jgi:hypothetical protein
VVGGLFADHGMSSRNVSRRVIRSNFIIGGASLIENGLSLKDPLFFFSYIFLRSLRNTNQENPSEPFIPSGQKGAILAVFRKIAEIAKFSFRPKKARFWPFFKKGHFGAFFDPSV